MDVGIGTFHVLTKMDIRFSSPHSTVQLLALEEYWTKKSIPTIDFLISLVVGENIMLSLESCKLVVTCRRLSH